jgi:hypothetical protein
MSKNQHKGTYYPLIGDFGCKRKRKNGVYYGITGSEVGGLGARCFALQREAGLLLCSGEM